MAPTKTDQQQQAARQVADGLGRAELNRLLAGSLARRVRERMVAGEPVDLGALAPDDIVGCLDGTGRAAYAAVKVLAAAGQAPSEDQLARQAGKLGLHSQTHALRQAWRDSAGLEDQLDALAEQLRALPAPRGTGCTVDVTQQPCQRRSCQACNRPREIDGEVYPPGGITVRTRVRSRAHWLRLKTCRHLRIDVVEGTPPDRGASLLPKTS